MGTGVSFELQGETGGFDEEGVTRYAPPDAIAHCSGIVAGKENDVDECGEYVSELDQNTSKVNCTKALNAAPHSLRIVKVLRLDYSRSISMYFGMVYGPCDWEVQYHLICNYCFKLYTIAHIETSF